MEVEGTRHVVFIEPMTSDISIDGMPNSFLFSHVDLAEALYTVNVSNVICLFGSVVSVAVTNLNYVNNMVRVQLLLGTFFSHLPFVIINPR